MEQNRHKQGLTLLARISYTGQVGNGFPSIENLPGRFHKHK